MKDIIIKKEVIKRELLILVLLFVVAILMNAYAIVVHSGQWSELITQLHVVVLLTLFLYVVVLLIRLLIWGSRVIWLSVIDNRDSSKVK